MFSSLASLIFGTTTATGTTKTTTTTSKEDNPNSGDHQTSEVISDTRSNVNKEPSNSERANTILVTSSSPSVTNGGTTTTTSGSGSVIVVHNHTKRGKPGKKQRNNNQQPVNRNNKQQKNKSTEVEKTTKHENALATSKKPSIVDLLSSKGDHFADDDFNEDDWFIVEKEDDEIGSQPRTDSEEEPELSVAVEIAHETNKQPAREEELANVQGERLQKLIVALPAASAVVAVVQQQRRRQQLIDTHALYNGPRHQQQRNFLQRKRNGAVRGSNTNIAANPTNVISGSSNKNALVKAASVERDVPLVVATCEYEDDDNPIMTQSLYFGDGYGANASMDESWFVTPPPCFTSIGPINMVTSPFENLLIEHPSMSVYHSIRSAQRAQESFVSVEIEDNELVESNQNNNNNTNNQGTIQIHRSQVPRIEHYTATQLKQEIFARNAQKCQERRERQNMGRGAIKRMNKVRDGSNKNQRPRRSDFQHAKVLSGANNNRKICY